MVSVNEHIINTIGTAYQACHSFRVFAYSGSIGKLDVHAEELNSETFEVLVDYQV